MTQYAIFSVWVSSSISYYWEDHHFQAYNVIKCLNKTESVKSISQTRVFRNSDPKVKIRIFSFESSTEDA